MSAEVYIQIIVKQVFLGNTWSNIRSLKIILIHQPFIQLGTHNVFCACFSSWELVVTVHSDWNSWPWLRALNKSIQNMLNNVWYGRFVSIPKGLLILIFECLSVNVYLNISLSSNTCIEVHFTTTYLSFCRIAELSSLKKLSLGYNKLTSLPER